MKIFVGNIAPELTEDELKQLFSQFGDVRILKIIFDKYTNESRRFGFVTMADAECAISAIKKLNGKKYKGKKLQVNQARTQVKARKRSNRRNGLPNYD